MSAILDHTPWEGSYLVLDNVPDTGVSMIPSVDTILLYVLVAVGVALIVSFPKFLAGIGASFELLFIPNRDKEILNNSYKLHSIIEAYFILLPFYVLPFSEHGMEIGKYWVIFAVFAAFLLFRHFVFALSGWLLNRKDMFRALERTGFASFLIISVLSLIVVFLFLASVQIPRKVAVIYMGLSAALCLSVYFAKSLKFFIDTNLSVFFWILYLCSFEILPMCVAVNIIFSNGY